MSVSERLRNDSLGLLRGLGRKLVPCLRRRGEASSDALAPLRRSEGDSVVIREELSRLFKIEERHLRLLARLLLAFGLSILVYAAGAILNGYSRAARKAGISKDSVTQPSSPPCNC